MLSAFCASAASVGAGVAVYTFGTGHIVAASIAAGLAVFNGLASILTYVGDKTDFLTRRVRNLREKVENASNKI